MILKSLKILLQNVRKNALIVHSLLKTQNYYNIILIQESPHGQKFERFWVYLTVKEILSLAPIIILTRLYSAESL